MMELTLFYTLEWWQQAFRNSVKDVIQDSKTIGCKQSNTICACVSCLLSDYGKPCSQYREVISLLRKGYSVRDVAKLSG